MKIYGYSERGMINSLMYNIGEDKELLKAFINLISLPESINIEDVDDFEIIIEQSLSQFGDADLIIIAHCNNNKKKVLFFEAKVKTSQGNWIIGDQFAKFTDKDKGKYNGYSSNLFYQLYLKKLLIDNYNSIMNGVIVKDRLGKDRRRGENEIVKKAAKMISEGTSYYYIGIIPTMDDDIKAFLDSPKEKYDDNLYFLSWKAIKDFCEKEKLQKVLKMFEFNDGQIY